MRAEELGIAVPPGASRPQLEAIVSQAEQGGYCQRCGARVQPGSGFCPVCGAAFATSGSGTPVASVGTESTAPDPRHRFSRVTPGKTSAVRVFMFIAGSLNLAAVAAGVNEISKFNAWWSAPATNDLRQAEDWVNAEALSGGVLLVALLATIVLWILLMVWGNHAYKDALTMEPVGRRWGPGWAVGGWFIPFANFVIPKLVFNEIDRITHPDNTHPLGAWHLNRVRPDGNWWWVLVVAGWFVAGVAARVAVGQVDASFDADTYRTALWFGTGALAAEGIGWFFGARYFRSLGARFHG